MKYEPIALPMPRLPECSITQAASASSRQSSMKWLPPPSVPIWFTQLELRPMRLSMPGWRSRILRSPRSNFLAA